MTFRYRAKLGHYGLAEEYFDETNGACDLKCDNMAFCTPPKWGSSIFDNPPKRDSTPIEVKSSKRYDHTSLERFMSKCEAAGAIPRQR